MKSARSFVLCQKERCQKFARRNGRYIGVGAVFLVAIWYNLAVAPSDELEKDKHLDFSGIEEDSRKADLTQNHPEKVYVDMLQAMPGDWYRIGIAAEAFESDEVLDVVAVSDTGMEKVMGTMELEKGEAEKYQEFVFLCDDAYRDVRIRKRGEEEYDQWSGGDVVLAEVFATRLDISTQTQAQQLEPTIRKEAKTRDVLVRDDMPEKEEIFFPGGRKFVAWGILESPGNRLISLAFSAKKALPETNGKYIVEVRGYHPPLKIVDKKVLAEMSFTEAEAMAAAEKGDGIIRFELPGAIEADMSYVVGIRLDEDRGPGGLEFTPIVAEDASRGLMLAEILPSLEGDEGVRLLSGARIEDVGSYLRYEYRNAGVSTDFFNIDRMSDSVEFDSSCGCVLADAEREEFFSYEFDFLSPASEVFVRARQYRDYEDQIAMEYSFDGKGWKEIPYRQDNDDSQRFAYTIEPPSGTSKVFIAVRYAGEEDTDREFGLDLLEVTAKLVKP